MKKLLLLIGALFTLQSCISPVNESDIPSGDIDSSHFDLSNYPSLSHLILDSSLVISGRYMKEHDIWLGRSEREVAKTVDSTNLDYLVIIQNADMLETALALASYRNINQSDAITKARVVVLDHTYSNSGLPTTRSNFRDLLKSIDYTHKSSSIDDTHKSSETVLHIALISRPFEFNAVPLPFSDRGLDSDYYYTNSLEMPVVIGRIPLASNIEGVEYLQKLVSVEPKLQREASFLADDRWVHGNMESLKHYDQVSSIAASLSEIVWEQKVLGIHEFSDSLHYDDFYDTLMPGPLTDKEVEKARDSIINLFNLNSGCITYMGHAGPHKWSDEDIFTNEMIPLMETNNILIANNYVYDMKTGERSLTEKMLLNENGIIASVTPTHSFSYASSNERFIKMFYKQIDSSPTLGEAYYKAMQIFETDYFCIMGDPALNITGLHR